MPPAPDSTLDPPGAPSEVPFGDELIRTVKLLSALRHQAPRAHPDVDPMVYPLLFHLLVPQRVGDLADKVRLDISTVSRHVAHLAGLGIIERRPDPTDGRAQQLTLTEAGREMLMTLRRNRDAWLCEVVQDWTEEDRQILAQLLTRLNAGIEHVWPERPAS